jgi:hypothetical protein
MSDSGNVSIKGHKAGCAWLVKDLSGQNLFWAKNASRAKRPGRKVDDSPGGRRVFVTAFVVVPGSQ